MTALKRCLHLGCSARRHGADGGTGADQAEDDPGLEVPGPDGIYFLAADRGYFKEEGLDITFDQGEGAGAAAPKVASGAYDIGFGSLDSVIAAASHAAGGGAGRGVSGPTTAHRS